MSLGTRLACQFLIAALNISFGFSEAMLGWLRECQNSIKIGACGVGRDHWRMGLLAEFLTVSAKYHR